MLSGVSSVSFMAAEGPGNCGSVVLIAEEFDGVGEKGTRDTTIVDVATFFEALYGGHPDL
jgi:hypothetical protein